MLQNEWAALDERTSETLVIKGERSSAPPIPDMTRP
jgi:hypothetical protein